MIGSVLKAFDKSKATEKFMVQKAKLARFELFTRKVMQGAKEDLKELFDRVFHSDEFKTELGLETSSVGSIKFTYDDIVNKNKDLQARVKSLEVELASMNAYVHKMRIQAMKDIQVHKEQKILAMNNLNEDYLLRQNSFLEVSFFDPLEKVDP